MSLKTPAYLKLYETLRDAILRGTYPPGSALPSRRQMSAEQGLSAVTVEHAYSLLQQEGYIEARPRSGYRVIYQQSDGFAPGRLPPAARPQPPQEQESAFPFSVLARAMRRVGRVAP